MTTSMKTLLCLLGLAGASAPLAGCNDTASTVLVANGYPAGTDADGGVAASTTVFKVWWTTTLIADPVAPGATSAAERTVPGDDFAYALLAPSWSPDRGGAPPALIAARSAARLSVARGDQLEIMVSDETFDGDCAAGKPLDAETAALIVESIFPGDFAGARYDPSTCTTTPVAVDAGVTADGAAD
jgi:hypothetical protein